MKSILSVLTPEESQGIGKKWYDGSIKCRICGASIMIYAGSAPSKSRKALAMASHIEALHTKRDALGHKIR